MANFENFKNFAKPTLLSLSGVSGKTSTLQYTQKRGVLPLDVIGQFWPKLTTIKIEHAEVSGLELSYRFWDWRG